MICWNYEQQKKMRFLIQHLYQYLQLVGWSTNHLYCNDHLYGNFRHLKWILLGCFFFFFFALNMNILAKFQSAANKDSPVVISVMAIVTGHKMKPLAQMWNQIFVAQPNSTHALEHKQVWRNRIINIKKRELWN